MEYHVFDVVDYTKSFAERFFPVGDKIDEAKFGNYVTTFTTAWQSELDDCYNIFVSQGYEGQMIRLGDCPYTVTKQKSLYPKVPVSSIHATRSGFLSDKDNRVWHLLKRKSWQDDEFSCIGIEEGEGKYKGTLGALKCQMLTPLFGDPKGNVRVSHFTVSSGLTDAERDFYWQNPPISHLIKVRYLCLSQDGIPLNPSVLAIL